MTAVVSSIVCKDSVIDTTAKPNTCQKVVSFSSSVQVRLIGNRKERTAEEKAATWFSSEEYQHIQRTCRKQVLMMDQGRVLRNKKYCARGLEGYTTIGRKVKEQIRRQSIDAVMEEQGRQMYHEGIVDVLDVNTLSQVYQAVAGSSQLWANAKALQDQHDALSQHNEEDEEKIVPNRSETPRSSTLFERIESVTFPDAADSTANKHNATVPIGTGNIAPASSVVKLQQRKLTARSA